MTTVNLVGQALGGRYQIQSLIGQGGMASVFMAYDINLRRPVAVKVIHPQLSDNPEFFRRFEEEATSVAQLRHPNIVHMYDFNHEGDLYYMVMEFILGESLQSRLKRLNASKRRLDIKEVVSFTTEICEAAFYAHQRGMVHRDIKPSNIMLDVNGKAILMDFGIARMVGASHHTAAGTVLGTAMYMSPEQIQGLQIDGRADIYSIGITLFEMLSGKPPFEADSAMTLMMMHLNDPVPDLHELQPDTPPDLVGITNKALAKNREQRYQTANEMATSLRKWSEALQKASGAVVQTSPETMPVEDTEKTVVEAPLVTPIQETYTPLPTVVQTPPPQPESQPTLIDQTVQEVVYPATLKADAMAIMPPAGKRRKVWIPILAVLLILILTGGGYYAYTRLISGDGLFSPSSTLVAGRSTPTLKIIALQTPSPISTRSPTSTKPIPSIPPSSTPFVAITQENGEFILYSQDFESGQAPEWNLGPGWQVIAYDGSHVLQGEGHALARLQQGPWTDLSLRFRLRLNQDRSAVLANIRVNGAARYFIEFTRGGIKINKQEKDQTFQFNLANGKSPGEGWHDIEIEAYVGTISVNIDGIEFVQYSDPNPLPGGSISFESTVAQQVWIDDVVVGLKPPPEGYISNPPSQERSAMKWEYLGGPLGGLGYDVRMRPDNPDVMYVTDARAGVFRSKDGGKTWQPINNGITTRIGETGEIIPVFCLTIDPHNSDIIWAGTQSQTGLFKSLNGGDTWIEMDNGLEGQSLTLRGITVDPRTSDIVYVAGERSSWEWAGKVVTGHEFDLTKGVVYKTTNGGQSWKKVWSGDNLARYIWIDPRNPDVIYVSTGIFDREAANSNYSHSIAGGVGVIKSIDGGNTWTTVNNGLENLYIGSLFMHPQNPDILLAGVGCVTYPQGSGIYITSNGGVSWKKTMDTYTIAAVEFSTSDPKVAYAGSVNSFFRSLDGGLSWQLMNNPSFPMWGPPGVAVGTPIDIQVDPRNAKRLFVNAYGGGNFLSEDGGATWQIASTGYSGSMVRDLALDPRGSSIIYSATRSGLFISLDGGIIWNGLANGEFQTLDWHAVAINPENPEIILSEQTCDRALLFSSDGGRHWQKVLTANSNIAFKSLEFAPSNPDIAYAGTAGFISCGSFQADWPGQGIYISRDGGHTWTEANDENTIDAAISQLAIDSQDPQTVFIATFNHRLLKTSNGGISWKPVIPGNYAGDSFTAVQLSPHDSNLVLAGRYQGGLLRSQDGGASWQSSVAGLNPEATVMDIVFDPQQPHVVYIADVFSGIYLSLDYGVTWSAINSGLDMRAVNALALSGDGLHLYAGTEGRGVFRLDLNGLPPEPVQISPLLSFSIQAPRLTLTTFSHSNLMSSHLIQIMTSHPMLV